MHIYVVRVESGLVSAFFFTEEVEIDDECASNHERVRVESGSVSSFL